MYIAIIFGILAGVFCGGAGMYHWQRRQREQELKRIAGLAEDILAERVIRGAASGQETIYGKLEHRLVRVQEMMQGSRDEAKRSRDEIQRLISEIAHQMRTPLTNLETYLGFLQEMAEDDENEGVLRSLDAAGESAGKLHFLVESFIRMSRLEQHIIQIKKEETDILRTVRNALGQIQCQAEEKELKVTVSRPGQAGLAHDANWLGEAGHCSGRVRARALPGAGDRGQAWRVSGGKKRRAGAYDGDEPSPVTASAADQAEDGNIDK